MATITELDLSAGCYQVSIADRINAVPGLRPSTAFFSFLRANLVLNPSAMSSDASSPPLDAVVGPAPPSPARDRSSRSPSPTSSKAKKDPLEDVPPLSLEILTDHDDKLDAINLVTDSIAQQRQRAALTLVFHPFCLAGLAVLLAGAYQYMLLTRRTDLGTALLVFSGVMMTYLFAIRYVSSPYIQIAEAMRWDWFVSDVTGEDDIILGTKFGNEMIGALVLRLEPGPAAMAAAAAAGSNGRNSNNNNNSNGGGGSSKKKHNRRNSAGQFKGGRGVVRAWTTKLRFRGRGVGVDMLHEAVRITRERCGRDAEVGFAREHANSTMVLPDIFNGVFRKREMRAAKAMADVLGEWEGTRRKR